MKNKNISAKEILFIITLFIMCIGVCCINCIPDNDLWARLIAGEYIVKTFSVLKEDFLSYTQTHTWFDHEWGASIFFYIALKYFGHSGLIFLKGILAGLTMFFCYRTVKIQEPKSTISYNILYFAFMFYVVNNSLGTTVRCLLFTCLFFSMVLYLLEKYRKNGDTKSLFFIPLIMLIWGNIHGGCISGLGLLGLYSVGEYLNKKPIKHYIITILSSILVLFINPYGIEYVKFLFFAATMDRTYISEWKSPFDVAYTTMYLRYKFYILFIVLTQIIYIIKNKISFKKIDKTKILTIIVMLYLSITHLRHIPFFVLTAGTLLYDEFYSLVKDITNKIKEKFKLNNENGIKTFILIKETFVYFCIIILTLPIILTNNKQIKITTSRYPRYAIEFIKMNKLEGNLFLNFDWGSYASYKLFPQNKIVMDGRYEEVYQPDLLLEMKDFHLVEGDWKKIIRDYKTDVMILEKKYPVYNKILQEKDWKLVFNNNLYGVFVPANTVKENYLLPTIQDEYYNKTLFYKGFRF